MRRISVGQRLFAATFVGLGILGVSRGDFTPVWQPVATTTPGRELLAYVCALVSCGCGAGLLLQRTAATAARALLAFLLLWLVLIRFPDVWPAPRVLGSWFGCCETAVIVAGAWALYARLAAGWDTQHLRFACGDGGLRIARVLCGVALIYFGVAHYVYLAQTEGLVPKVLPSPQAWALLTGTTYIAAGLSLTVGVWSRAAAAFAALQMAAFTLLVWIPAIAGGSATAYQWSETVLSWALSISTWVIAESSLRPNATR